MLRVSPLDGDPWDVAVSAPNWWRTPDPSVIAVISEYTGYLLDVVRRRVVVAVPNVDRAREDELHGQLLMTGDVDVVAVTPEGIRWTARESVGGDLKVEAVHVDRIVVSHLGEGPRAELTLDPATGRRL